MMSSLYAPAFGGGGGDAGPESGAEPPAVLDAEVVTGVEGEELAAVEGDAPWS